MEDKPPGLELQNSFGALGETDSEQETPLASFDDFPSLSREFECEKTMVTRHGNSTPRHGNKRKHGENPKSLPGSGLQADKNYIHLSGWEILMTNRDSMQ